MTNGPFITACYQPVVVAISTLGAIVLGFEKGASLKYVAITICLSATGFRLFYDSFYDTYAGSGRQFVGKFYVFNQVFLQSIGVLLQRKMIAYTQCSLIVLSFYIYGFGFLISIVIYNAKYWNDTYNSNSGHNTQESYHSIYFTFEYLWTLSKILMIYSTLILTECFRYLTLLFINREGHISKVTLYGALDAFYVVIIWKVFETTFAFDYFFIGLIALAYIMLLFSKYKLSRLVKVSNKEKGKLVKFKRAIKELETAELLQSQTKIVIEGNYFYESNHDRGSTRGIIFSQIGTDKMNNSYYGHSELGQKQILLTQTYNNVSQGKTLLSASQLKEIQEEEEEMLEGNGNKLLQNQRGSKTTNFVNVYPIMNGKNGAKSQFNYSIADTVSENSD